MIKPLIICAAPTAGKSVLSSLLEGHPAVMAIPNWHDNIACGLSHFPDKYKQMFGVEPGEGNAALTIIANDRRLECLRALACTETDMPQMECAQAQGFCVYGLSKAEWLHIPLALDFDFYDLERIIYKKVWAIPETPTFKDVPFLFDVFFSALHQQMFPHQKEPEYAVSMAHNEFFEFHHLLDTYPEGKILHIVREPADALSSYVYRLAYADGVSFMEKWEEYKNYKWFLSQGVDKKEMLEGLAKQYPDRIFSMDFRELVLNTEPVMRRVADWLGIDFQSSLLRPTAQGKLIHERFIGEIQDDMQKILSKQEWELVNKEIKDFSERKAYELDQDNVLEITFHPVLFSTNLSRDKNNAILIPLNAITDTENLFYGPFEALSAGIWEITWLFSCVGEDRENVLPKNGTLFLDCEDEWCWRFFAKAITVEELLRQPSFQLQVDNERRFHFRAYGNGKIQSNAILRFDGVRIKRKQADIIHTGRRMAKAIFTEVQTITKTACKFFHD